MRRPKDKIPEERGEWWQRMLWPGRLYSRRTPYAAQCAAMGTAMEPGGRGRICNSVAGCKLSMSTRASVSGFTMLRLTASLILGCGVRDVRVKESFISIAVDFDMETQHTKVGFSVS